MWLRNRVADIRSARHIHALAFYALVISSDPVAAQDLLEQTRQLITSRQFEEAATLLHNVAALPNYDPLQVRFLLGYLSIEQGRYSHAIEIFSEILSRRPDLERIRLELARAYFLAGTYEQARRHFNEALASHPPAPVESNIRAYLQNIDKRLSWQYEFAAEVVSDNNANYGTSAENVNIAGLPFQLAPESRKTGALGTAIGAVARRVLFAGQTVEWNLEVAIFNRNFPGDAVDDFTTRLSVGPSFQAGSSRIAVVAVSAERRFGHAPLFGIYGLKIEASPADPSKPGWNGYFSVNNMDWNLYSDRNGLSMTGGLSHRLAYSQQTHLSFGLSAGKDDLNAEFRSNSSLGYTFSWRQYWPWAVVSDLGYRSDTIKYRASEPLFDKARGDHSHAYWLNLSLPAVKVYEMHPHIAVTSSKSNSNIDLYSTNRTVLTIGLSRRF